MEKRLENLNNSQIKLIKETFLQFDYLVDATSNDIKPALKWFAHDRKLSKRELELVVLNYLFLYETEYKNQTLQHHVTTDAGLLGLFGTFERVRGVTGFEKLEANLSLMNSIYNEWCGK